MCGLSTASQVVLGGGLALSSSAFVLQLLKDKDEMRTKFGRSSFGVLLLQDLAVVPLLVITPILAGGGDGLASALGSAGIKAAIALSAIAVLGRFVLKPFFGAVVKAKSQEAFVGAILSTVLGMSFLTEGLGLSNTLGAFLAGVLMSETDHRHDIEREIAPFRGILVGLFFFSVGFEIDLALIASKGGLVASVVLGIVVLKSIIASTLSVVFGLSRGTALRVGLILSQGGEFAFVAFRLARSCGILSNETTKLMLTCVSLTMGLTPFLDDFGAKMAARIDAKPTVKVTVAKKVASTKGSKKKRV
jgi:monovalent cation:H+ antiporter-2, CPA2 family